MTLKLLAEQGTRARREFSVLYLWHTCHSKPPIGDRTVERPQIFTKAKITNSKIIFFSMGNGTKVTCGQRTGT